MVLFLLFAAICPAGELQDAADRYAEQLKAIEDEDRRERTALAVKYLAGLERVEAAGKNEGSLDKVLGAQKELERFNKAQTLTPADIVEADYLKKGQQYFLKEFGNLDRRTATAKAKLRKEYREFLKTLEVRLVKANKIDEAKKVRGLLADLEKVVPPTTLLVTPSPAPSGLPGLEPAIPLLKRPVPGVVPAVPPRPGDKIPFTIKIQNKGSLDDLDDKTQKTWLEIKHRAVPLEWEFQRIDDQPGRFCFAQWDQVLPGDGVLKFEFKGDFHSIDISPGEDKFAAKWSRSGGKVDRWRTFKMTRDGNDITFVAGDKIPIVTVSGRSGLPEELPNNMYMRFNLHKSIPLSVRNISFTPTR